MFRSDFDIYLQPTYYIDSDHPEIVAFAGEKCIKSRGEKEQAISLFYAVRDGVRYDPYSIEMNPISFKASETLKRKKGYCVAKAILLASLARVMGIPSRLCFADVRNHLTTERLKEMMKTDIFVFHGYTELYLDGRWIKATPTFNNDLCIKFGVSPLEFDGKTDCMLHEFDEKGHKHMEYLKDHGQFADLPVEKMLISMRDAYPIFFQDSIRKIYGDFEKEAAADMAAKSGSRSKES
ncbi:MAG: transglutaminase family protein [Desulfobacteraceae bacterium]|nr:MAG: transglutaminase family protein [Desulfobacteraceae bacterium]